MWTKGGVLSEDEFGAEESDVNRPGDRAARPLDGLGDRWSRQVVLTPRPPPRSTPRKDHAAEKQASNSGNDHTDDGPQERQLKTDQAAEPCTKTHA